MIKNILPHTRLDVIELHLINSRHVWYMAKFLSTKLQKIHTGFVTHLLFWNQYSINIILEKAGVLYPSITVCKFQTILWCNHKSLELSLEVYELRKIWIHFKNVHFLGNAKKQLNKRFVFLIPKIEKFGLFEKSDRWFKGKWKKNYSSCKFLWRLMVLWKFKILFITLRVLGHLSFPYLRYLLKLNFPFPIQIHRTFMAKIFIYGLSFPMSEYYLKDFVI